jgi:PAS domain S-box-containing protein
MPAPLPSHVRSLGEREARTRASAIGFDNRQALLNPIITMDEGGVIRSASDSVEQVFGWTPIELLGKNVKLLIPEPRRSSLDRYLDRYRRTDTGKEMTRTRRFCAVRKDGSRIQIELSMSRAELPIHSAPFFIGIVRDVSKLIDVDEDSPEERSRLHALVIDQTRALATAHLRLHLADRMAALGTLAAGLGHDLNNALLPVRARLDVIERAHSVTIARMHVKAVREQVAYLQSLSDGLHALTLDFDGHQDTEGGAGVTRLSEWWKQVGPLLRTAVPKRVTLKAALPADIPSVSIAQQWITQAVLNLIVNASEAIPRSRKGVIKIWADTRNEGKLVRLGVTDNGSGMSRDVQRRALDLFFTTKSRTMGTGLGLPLARKVALRAGGELRLSSQPGRGTTVILEFPASTENSDHSRTKGKRQRVAVVTLSDRRVEALICEVLRGANVTIRSSVGRGLGSADIWMTEPSSKSLALAVRWRKRRTDSILAIVGSPSARTRKGWADLGAISLGKGDDIQTVRRAIGKALARK